MGASVGSAGGDCRKDGNDGNDAIDGGEESDGKNIGSDDTEDAVGSSVDDGGSCSSFEDLMAIKLPYREILCALLADSLLPASPSSSSSSSLSARAQLSPLLHLVSKHHILRADDYPVLSEKDAKTKNKLETIIDRLTSR